MKEIYQLENIKMLEIEKYKMPNFKTFYDQEKEVVDIKAIDDSKVHMHLDYMYELIKLGFKVKMPDRNIKIRRLFNFIVHLKDLENATLIRFDIKNFYRSIDIKKFIKRIDENEILRVNEKLYLKYILNNEGELYPGVKISNIISECMGNLLDYEIKKEYKQIIFYSRYVDDVLMIVNDEVNEELFLKHIKKTSKMILGNKVEIHDSNSSKYTFFTKNSNSKKEVSYLGYQFELDDSMKIIKYGIAEEKIKKCEKKLERILYDFKKNNNYWMFKLRIDSFYKRVVALSTNDYKTNRWAAYGISQTYKELKRVNSKYLNKNTKELINGKKIYKINNEKKLVPPKKLANIIDESIKRDHFEKLFYNNKALIFNTHIGLKKDQLKQIAEKLGVEYKYKNYTNLSNDLMKKLLVIK